MPVRRVKACVGISAWAKIAGWVDRQGGKALQMAEVSSQGNLQARVQLGHCCWRWEMAVPQPMVCCGWAPTCECHLHLSRGGWESISWEQQGAG